MITFFLSLLFFCGLDSFLQRLRLEGRYYGVHALHNMAITAFTTSEVITTLTNFSSIHTYPTNYIALELCTALHLYHILYYFQKLRLDDWLHHILMIGVALPIGGVLPAGTLLGYSLFFTTGLPGGIDYILLFLVRNNWLHRNTEKKANHALNVWIRSPGCASHAALVCAYLSMHETSILFMLGALTTAFLNYWNGQYFMQQVVYDAGSLQLFQKIDKHSFHRRIEHI